VARIEVRATITKCLRIERLLVAHVVEQAGEQHEHVADQARVSPTGSRSHSLCDELKMPAGFSTVR